MSLRSACPLTFRPADQHAIARYLHSLPARERAGSEQQPIASRRAPNAELLVEQPGGGELAYQIAITGSTKKKVDALIGTFMYDEAHCTVVARSVDGEEVWIRGTISKCNFVSGRIHFVSIAIDSPLDVGEIIDL